jgi:hypothetical protein
MKKLILYLIILICTASCTVSMPYYGMGKSTHGTKLRATAPHYDMTADSRRSY